MGDSKGRESAIPTSPAYNVRKAKKVKREYREAEGLDKTLREEQVSTGRWMKTTIGLLSLKEPEGGSKKSKSLQQAKRV